MNTVESISPCRRIIALSAILAHGFPPNPLSHFSLENTFLASIKKDRASARSQKRVALLFFIIRKIFHGKDQIPVRGKIYQVGLFLQSFVLYFSFWFR